MERPKFNLYIMDWYTFQPKTIIQKFTSLIWTSCYSEPGSFELYVPFTEELVIAINDGGKYIYRDDIKKVCFIENVIEKSETSGKMLVISGYSLEGLMCKKVFMGSFNMQVIAGPLHTLIRQYFAYGGVTRFCTMTDDYEYLYPWGINMGTGLLEPVNYQKMIYAGLNYYGLALTHEVISYEEGITYFNAQLKMWQGTDRTITSNNPILLSEKMGNVKNVIFQRSEAGCYNYVIVMGYWPSNDPDEMHQGQIAYMYDYNPEELNANDITSNHKEITAEVEVNVEYDKLGNPYYEVNVERTTEKFKVLAAAEYVPFGENFSADIIDPSIVNLGDIVTFRDDVRKTDYNKRVEKIVESMNANEVKYACTFGNSLQTTKNVVYKSIGF